MPLTFMMSSGDLNGPFWVRYSTMAWDLAGPMPGNRSKSPALAVLILICSPAPNFPDSLPVGVGACEARLDFSTVPAVPVDSLLGSEVVAVSSDSVDFFFLDALVLDLFSAIAVCPKVMSFLSALSFDFVMPETFCRSAAFLYGRPSMMFWAIVGPMPGNVSNVLLSAELMSTLAAFVDFFVWPDVPSFACNGAWNMTVPTINAAIMIAQRSREPEN